jgi:hypothetical protein
MASPSSTESPRFSSLPTEADLKELSHLLRGAAHERGLSDRIVNRYEEWAFLFLGWCLQVPPHRVDRDRIGEFWHALNHREVSRGKICLAMDALGFFFGSLADDATLGFSAPAQPDAENEPSDATAEELCAPLPDGPLPESVDILSVVPTQPPPDAAARPDTNQSSSSSTPAAEPPPEDPPSFWTLLKSEEDANPFEEDDVLQSEEKEETVSVDLPKSVVDRAKTMARRRNLSVEDLITTLLDSVGEDETSSTSPVHA